MDREAWRAVIHGVAKSLTGLSNCVSWVPRLTLMNLRTNWIYEHALRTKLQFVCRGLTVYCLGHRVTL